MFLETNSLQSSVSADSVACAALEGCGFSTDIAKISCKACFRVPAITTNALGANGFDDQLPRTQKELSISNTFRLYSN